VTDEPLGSHVLELQVADVVAETDDARCLVFKVPDGAQIPAQRLAYAPGQFLTLRVPSDRTGSVARCYSLCSSPFTDDALTVTVKRTEGGYASNWLCDHAHPGMKLHVLAPSGTFVPPTLDADFLLVAAGSGITPMMSICTSALIEGGGKVVLLYANRDENSVIFGTALRDLAAKYPDRLTVVHWLESVQGLPTAGALAADLRAVGRYREALAMDEKTYPAWTAQYGEDHPRTLLAANNLSVSLQLTGAFAAAMRLNADTHERRRTALGPKHLWTLGSARRIARNLLEAGQYARAVAQICMS